MNKAIILTALALFGVVYAAKNAEAPKLLTKPLAKLNKCNQGVVRWEYTYEKIFMDQKTEARMKQLSDWLTKAGDNGWDLVEMDDKGKYGMFLTFKRPTCALIK